MMTRSSNDSQLHQPMDDSVPGLRCVTVAGRSGVLFELSILDAQIREPLPDSENAVGNHSVNTLLDLHLDLF